MCVVQPAVGRLLGRRRVVAGVGEKRRITFIYDSFQSLQKCLPAVQVIHWPVPSIHLSGPSMHSVLWLSGLLDSKHKPLLWMRGKYIDRRTNIMPGDSIFWSLQSFWKIHVYKNSFITYQQARTNNIGSKLLQGAYNKTVAPIPIV